jgi:parallel beta-helix repeat protein
MGALLLSAATVFADTIPGGDVSGIWYADSSPYYITGSITVQAADTLVIEPGVLVNFLGYYTFTVNGYLEAVGTENDSIFFTSSTGWSGMTVVGAPDSSYLVYCVLEQVGSIFGALYCINSNPVISHCRISDNEAYNNDGAINLYGSNPEISYCLISQNAGQRGGGMLVSSGSIPHISHCTFTGNHGPYYGGGIAIQEAGSHPVFDSCLISDNHAIQGGGIAILSGGSCTLINSTISADTVTGASSTAKGGGIYVESPAGSLVIVNSTIDSCYGQYWGGGIYIQSAASVSIERSILDANKTDDRGCAIHSVNCGNLLIDHCDVVNNYGYFPIASGIYLGGATALTLTNSIFRSQHGEHIIFYAYTSAAVSYSDFYDWGSGVGPFGGSPPAGLGALVQTNANGDSCDIYYNILMDPMFADFPGGNYYLTDSSPCIDAGDPASPYDPDSTITDMGSYFFDQRMPSIALSTTALNFGGVLVGQSVDLPFVICNIGDGILRISNISNSLSVFVHDWSPLDSIVPPGDSLEVMITFTPDDTVAFTDTLWIANNDTLCCVTLVGQGVPPGVAEGTLAVPQAFALRQPLPSPCKSFARVQFELPEAGAMTLCVYDVSGRLVSQLFDGLCDAGMHEVILDASGLSAGVYFCRLKAGEHSAIRKVIITN